MLNKTEDAINIDSYASSGRPKFCDIMNTTENTSPKIFERSALQIMLLLFFLLFFCEQL